MIVADGQMGTFNIGKFESFIPNSFPNRYFINGFSISQKPHFRITLKNDAKRTKPIWVFYVKRSNFSVFSVFPKGESLNQSINNGFLDEEFKFEPAFNEYVKALESVRDNSLVQNVDDYYSKKSSTRKNFLDSSIERDKSGEDGKIGNWDRGAQHPDEFLERTSQRTGQNSRRGELGYRGSDRNLIDVTGLGMHENGNDVESNRTNRNFVDGSSKKGSRGSSHRLGSGKSGRRENDSYSRGKTGSGMYRELNDGKGDGSDGNSKSRKLGYPTNYSGVQKDTQINGRWKKNGFNTVERKVGRSGISRNTTGAEGRERYEKFSIDKRSRSYENLGIANANLKKNQNKKLQQNGIWVNDQVNDVEIEMDKPGTNKNTLERENFYRTNVERTVGEPGINRNNVERKMGISKVNKNMFGRESFYRDNNRRKTGEPESITSTLERRMFYGSKAETKIGEYDIKKDISEKEIYYKRRVDGRTQETLLRSGEARMGEIKSKDEELNLHANDLERTDNYHGGISLRWDSYDTRAETHEQNTSEREARLLGDSVEKEKETIPTMVDIHHGDSSLRPDSYDARAGTHEQNRCQQYVSLHGDAIETEKQGPRSTEMHGNYIRTEEGARYKVSLRREEQRPSQVFTEDVDGSDLEMERAAFKSFEVFTDVRGRPRVLRMEMEERIQKLAKWLNGADINMPEWQFSKMIHSAKIRFTDHSILRIVQMLGVLGNWRRALQIVEWIQSHERFKSYKSRYIYTTVLNVLGKAKRPVEALNVFYAMRKQLSSYPDLAAYHCIAVTLGQAGYMKELFDVIDLMRAVPEKKFKLGLLEKWDPRLEPDVVIYNAVLNACVRRKQWEGAFWVLQQLKQQGINPSTTTYGLVMEVMLACGKYNLVHEFFRKVEKNSAPNALNYKVLVNTLWREGKPDEAVLAVQDMEKRGIVGSASLYYDLARCLCSFGRCQEALLQIDKICKVAKKPLVVTYTGLIQACLDSGSVQNGAFIFNQMHKFCCPNLVTCNIMLKSYVEHGMFEEAKDLFQKILDGSRSINTTDSRERVVPDKFTFNTLLEACFTEKRWDDFEDVYQQMLRNWYHFDSKRHLRMILEASRAGKGRSLDVTWEHLVQSGRVVPPPIIKERFCMKLQEDDCAAAISIISCHQTNARHAFSEKSWLDLFKANDNRLQKDTLVRLVREVSTLIANSYRPDPTFQNLLSSGRLFINNHVTTTAINPSEIGEYSK